MKARTRLTLALTLLSIAAGTAAANAQDTRAEEIRRQQSERQQRVSPPQPTMVERTIDRLEEWGFITGAPRGAYPWLGSIYPGGGVSAGAGVRKEFGDDGALNVIAGYSIRSYKIGQADVALPTFAKNRGTLTVSGQYLDAPDVKYYGVGNDSSKDARSYFGYTPTTAGTRLDFDITKHFKAGGEVSYLDVSTSAGRTAPSIDAEYGPANTPGFEFSQFGFINSTARASFDWRRRLGYSGSGGVYRAQFDDYRDQDHGRYSFRSLEAEALQLIPILRANWVIALRGVATVTDVDDANEVPFFLMPSIGGGASVRGYPDFRFRDRNRLVMNAELRWTPARFMDMLLFYDTGKVEARRQDLDFDNLKEAYGIGMRLIGPKGYALRAEAAHSREHRVRLTLSAGGAF
jgi:outer membrane protein assembly factor BamA